MNESIEKGENKLNFSNIIQDLKYFQNHIQKKYLIKLMIQIQDIFILITIL